MAAPALRYYDSVAALLASTAASFPTGDIIEADGCRYQSVASGEIMTATGGAKLVPVRGDTGLVTASQLGCEVARTQGAAVSTADGAARIQAALDAGYDVLLDGWVRIASQINTKGRNLIGAGRRQSGLWCSAAGSGVLVTGTGSTVRSLSIMSDYTATHLARVGAGVEGDTLDAYLFDLFVYGAKERCLLVREYSNGKSQRCIYRSAGARTGSSSITDQGSHSVEVRCFHHFIDCEASAATGYAIHVVGGTGWEESHLNWVGGRIQTGYKGLVLAVNYATDFVPLGVNIVNGYFENPGLTHAGGVNNASLGPAITAQGNVVMDIGPASKFMGRKATFLAAAYDGARINLPEGGPIKFSALGTSQLGALATVGKAATTAHASGILVSNGGILVTDSGTTYAPKPDQVPFTTTGTFDASKWVSVASQEDGQIFATGIPPIRSNDTNAFSTTDWLLFIDTPSTKNRLPIDFASARLVKELIDGTSTAGLTLNVCTAATSTTAGEFITGTSALKLTGSGSSGSANFSFSFDIPKHLVNKLLMVTTAFCFKQVGATFGSAGTMQPRIRVTAGTATVFPSATADAQNIATNLTLTPGDGNLTDWYFAQHVFQPLSAGTLTFTFVWDGVTGIRDDSCLVDNVRLWAIRSADFGAIA